jgi:hypothetical protein
VSDMKDGRRRDGRSTTNICTRGLFGTYVYERVILQHPRLYEVGGSQTSLRREVSKAVVVHHSMGTSITSAKKIVIVVELAER